jgi:hypothetical protein
MHKEESVLVGIALCMLLYIIVHDNYRYVVFLCQ